MALLSLQMQQHRNLLDTDIMGNGPGWIDNRDYDGILPVEFSVFFLVVKFTPPVLSAGNGKVDRLVGLKENVIIGKLIPARYLKEEQIAELKASEETEAMRLLASLAGPIEGELPAVSENSDTIADEVHELEDIAEEATDDAEEAAEDDVDDPANVPADETEEKE